MKLRAKKNRHDNYTTYSIDLPTDDTKGISHSIWFTKKNYQGDSRYMHSTDRYTIRRLDDGTAYRVSQMMGGTLEVIEYTKRYSAKRILELAQNIEYKLRGSAYAN